MGAFFNADDLSKCVIDESEATNFKSGAEPIERVESGYKVTAYVKNGKLLIDKITPIEDQCPDCRSINIEMLRSRRGVLFNHCIGCGHWWPHSR